MSQVSVNAIFCLMLLLGNNAPALAGLGKFTITDGSGDQVVVKHGLFGRKISYKDRYGNNLEKSRSIFGLTKDTKVGVLGNEMHSHKGLFGFSKTEGHSILGDSVTSSKNPFYRNTNVNLSGVDGFLKNSMQSKQANIPPATPASLNQGQNYSASPATPQPNP
jgi:hypothetical protein